MQVNQFDTMARFNGRAVVILDSNPQIACVRFVGDFKHRFIANLSELTPY